MESRLLSDIYMHFVLSGRDSRFAPEAYGFILASLDFERSRSGFEGHIKAKVLVQAVSDLALLKFGPLAQSVLSKWGVENSRNIGEMVYNLIDMDILTKTDDDNLEEFIQPSPEDGALSLGFSFSVNRSKLQQFHDA